MSKKPTFISLFSGCGGFDLGFLLQGFQCLGAYDNENTVINVYRRNIGEHIFNHDLTKAELPNKLEEVDVVISGSPCQGFSTVGLRKFEDPRNALLLIGGKIAVSHNAKVFVAENVMGSLSGKHKKYWDELITYLESNGYRTQITVCNAQDIGLAQTRKRVILYAWKGEKNNIELDYPNRQPTNLKDALKRINGSSNKEYIKLNVNSEDYLISKRIKEGQKLCDVRGGERAVHSWEIPEVFGECSNEEKEVLNLIQKLRRRLRRRKNGDADPVSKDIISGELAEINVENVLNQLIEKKYIVEKEPGFFDIKRSFNGKYRRLSFDSPSLTIDTNFGNPRYFLHPTEDRGFSVREAARIQGFPDDFVFEGPVRHQFKMIGNAVPPPMAGIIASNVKKLLNE